MTASLNLLQLLHQLAEARHVPGAPLLHLLPHHVPPEAHEGALSTRKKARVWLQRSPGTLQPHACAGASAYGGGARLQVGGAVSHHHHRLEAVLLLQDADDLPFAAALGRGLTLVEAGVLAWKTTTEELEKRDRRGSGGARSNGAKLSPLK